MLTITHIHNLTHCLAHGKTRRSQCHRTRRQSGVSPFPSSTGLTFSKRSKPCLVVCQSCSVFYRLEYVKAPDSQWMKSTSTCLGFPRQSYHVCVFVEGRATSPQWERYLAKQSWELVGQTPDSLTWVRALGHRWETLGFPCTQAESQCLCHVNQVCHQKPRVLIPGPLESVSLRWRKGTGTVAERTLLCEVLLPWAHLLQSPALANCWQTHDIK